MAGREALELGRGGVAAVARRYGMSPVTVRKGRDEYAAGVRWDPAEGSRRPGAGRRRATDVYPGLEEAVVAMVDAESYGSPSADGRRWTTMSTRKIARAMAERGMPVSHHVVRGILEKRGIGVSRTGR